MATVVHWDDRSPPAVYIGRGTPYGNPYHIGRDGDRAEVIAKFETYFKERLQTDPQFWFQVRSLSGQELACHCKPMDCHGDIIAAYLEHRFGA